MVYLLKVHHVCPATQILVEICPEMLLNQNKPQKRTTVLHSGSDTQVLIIITYTLNTMIILVVKIL